MVRIGLATLVVLSLIACGVAPERAAPLTQSEPVAADTLDVPVVAGEPPTAMTEAPAVPVELVAPGATGDVGRMSYVAQTWNNCGPASVVMALSNLGLDVTQEVARLALRGPDISRGMPAQNVSPWVEGQYGLKALVRTNGTRDLVRTFVANGFPVIVTQWLLDPPSRIAHYRVVRAYDDRTRRFLVNDPMRGAGVWLDYAWFDSSWQVFLYRYLVIYRPEDEGKVRAIVADDWADATMRARMYERAKSEAQTQGRHDSWIALGEAAYQLGLYGEAVAAFERGLSLGGAAGVFTMRSSYPNALRALGRDAEAEAVRAKLGGGR
jgi:hypothetical protein